MSPEPLSPDPFFVARLYRGAVSAAAAAVAGVPGLETPFIATSRMLWRTPVAGRACRSIAYRFAERLRARGDVLREINVHGVRLRVDATHWMFSGQYLAGVEYEPETARHILENLPPGGVFVDVGANNGLFTLLAAHRVGPAGRVFAFEPNPAVHSTLKEHVATNRLTDRVAVFDLALSDRPADAARLHVWPEHSGFSSLSTTAPGAQQFRDSAAMLVRTETFDRWVAEQGATLGAIDVLKMDVEGFESAVVAGMEATLAARRIARIICETQWGSDAHQRLVAHGYSAAILETVGPADNVIYTRPTNPA